MLGVMVRRRPGVTLSTANADLTSALQRSYRAQYEGEGRTASIAELRPRAIVAPILTERGPERSSAARATTWLSAVTLIVFSPVVSGKAPAPGTTDSLSMIKDTSIDFHWFPLDNPGLVSIPLAFFLGWLGTVTSKDHNEAKYAEMEVRSLTGVGAEKAVVH